jgi:serine/threonine protein phosphatase PrpC
MGSTAVVVVLQWNEEEKRTNLISANIGDSRAVLSRKGKAVELTMVRGHAMTWIHG